MARTPGTTAGAMRVGTHALHTQAKSLNTLIIIILQERTEFFFLLGAAFFMLRVHGNEHNEALTNSRGKIRALRQEGEDSQGAFIFACSLFRLTLLR